MDIVAVAETHIHNDYVSGGLRLSNRHGAEYLVAADEEVEFDRIGVHDNETLAFGDIDLRVIATPGHTPLHVAYLASDAGDADGVSALFSGGSLLHGTVGRTDLVDPALSTALARAQWLSARRLGALPGRPRCIPPTASAASAPARRRRRRRVWSRSPTSSRRTRTDDSEGHLRHPSARRASGRSPRHYAHMAPRNRSGPWTPRPGIRLEREYVFDALARGAQVVDVRSSCGLRGRPPARHARDPDGCPVRGVRRLGHAVGRRARVPLRLRRRARGTGERARLDRHRGSLDLAAASGRRARLDRPSSYGLGRVRRRPSGTERRRPGRTPPRGVARRAPRRLPQHRRARASPPARRDPAAARSGCTAPPATARRSRPACSTARAATSCWSTTSSRRSASSEFPCWVRAPRREPLKSCGVRAFGVRAPLSSFGG